MPATRLPPDTPLAVTIGNGAHQETFNTTWREFTGDNADDQDAGLEPALVAGKEFMGGGGAQPVYTVRVAVMAHG